MNLRTTKHNLFNKSTQIKKQQKKKLKIYLKNYKVISTTRNLYSKSAKYIKKNKENY